MLTDTGQAPPHFALPSTQTPRAKFRPGNEIFMTLRGHFLGPDAANDLNTDPL
ncbi:hypothetical protein [Sinorhizobium fredii]|uniref:hypothetical protein n=1 Tax=Rhizobium fredii TaxID=380 RepID=UPI0012FDB3F2|nr:hypothetical protein [Sinorhizobium fredii]